MGPRWRCAHPGRNWWQSDGCQWWATRLRSRATVARQPWTCRSIGRRAHNDPDGGERDLATRWTIMCSNAPFPRIYSRHEPFQSRSLRSPTPRNKLSVTGNPCLSYMKDCSSTRLRSSTLATPWLFQGQPVHSSIQTSVLQAMNGISALFCHSDSSASGSKSAAGDLL